MFGNVLICYTFDVVYVMLIADILLISQRFDMIHSPESSEWTLRIHKVALECLAKKLNFADYLFLPKRSTDFIEKVKEEDQGGYQCQAATSSGTRRQLSASQ